MRGSASNNPKVASPPVVAPAAELATGNEAPHPVSIGSSPPPGVYRVGNGATPPRVSNKEEPKYSEEARRAGLEGNVVLGLVVGSDGKPRNLRILRSLGLGLDERAIDAVSRWQFYPGTKDGQAVNLEAKIEVHFRLWGNTHLTHWSLAGISFKSPAGASRPQLVSAKRPSNPDSGESASIWVSFDVDEKGVPANLHVEGSSDRKWERKMLEAVQHWRFSPGMKDGKAVVTPCSLSFALGGNMSQ